MDDRRISYNLLIFQFEIKLAQRSLAKKREVDMERSLCLLFCRWKEWRGCLYERIVDLLPLSSFPWLSVPLALAMGIQTSSDHHTENSVMKISLFQQLTSVDADQ